MYSLRVQLPKGNTLKERKDAVEFYTTGIMKIFAWVTRTGIFTYHFTDGTVLKEMRRDKEVFKKTSLDTMQGVPLTVDHPPEMIHDITAIKRYSVGYFGDTIFIDGDLVGAWLFINDPATIDKVLSGDLVEISMGYYARTEAIEDPIADTEQFEITYNHGSLLPEGFARAGNRASVAFDNGLRIDSFEKAKFDDFRIKEKIETKTDNKEVKKTMLIELFGKKFDVSDEVGKQILEAKAKTDSAGDQGGLDHKVDDKDIKSMLSGFIATTEQKVTALTDSFENFKKDEAKRQDQRFKIIQDTKFILDDDKYDHVGKPDKEIMLDALYMILDEADFSSVEAMTDAEIKGQYDAEVRNFKKDVASHLNNSYFDDALHAATTDMKNDGNDPAQGNPNYDYKTDSRLSDEQKIDQARSIKQGKYDKSYAGN